MNCVYMPRRTTVLLDEEVYEELVRESLRKYGTVKALSKVLNEILLNSIRGRNELFKLIYSEKVTETTVKEFEEFRRKLSKRLES
ncbi:MAG: hypothetical protein QXU47_08010 [Candidatus Bathyarchaeia archaeon]